MHSHQEQTTESRAPLLLSAVADTDCAAMMQAIAEQASMCTLQSYGCECE